VKVHCLARRSKGKSHYTVFPLRVFAERIRASGIQLKIFRDHQRRELPECDLLIIVEGDFAKFLPPSERTRERECEFVKNIRSAGCRVAWFDDSDSSGYIRTYILPFVDAYWKSQALCSRADYTRDSPTGIAYQDYYVSFLGGGNPARRSKGPIDDQAANRIRLGWNIGLSDWRLHMAGGRLQRLWAQWNPQPAYPGFSAVKPLADRTVHLNCRVGTPNGWFPVGELRQRCVKLLESFSSRRGFHLASQGFLKRDAYFRELCDSVMCVSPFGLGEICYRDFECFAAGALLLKQDMGHLETYPSYFEPNITYVPFAWDFSDLDLKLADILAEPQRFQAIATNGRERFLDSLADGDGFASHFKQVCSEAFETRSQ
jgi:hypothetical protein